MAGFLANLEKYTKFLSLSVSVSGFRVSVGNLVIILAFLFGLVTVILEAKRQKDSPNIYVCGFILALLGGAAGARVYYLFFRDGQGLDAFAGWKQFVDIREGGLSVLGGVLGGIILVLILCWLLGTSFGRVADALTLGLLIALVVGDICCLAQGESYFYEAVWSLLVLLYLLVLIRRRKYDGEIFVKGLVAYSACKVVLEWFYGDGLLIPETELPVSLIVAAALLVLSLIVAVTRGVMAGRRKEVDKKRKEARYAERDNAQENMETEPVNIEELNAEIEKAKAEETARLLKTEENKLEENKEEMIEGSSRK